MKSAWILWTQSMRQVIWGRCGGRGRCFDGMLCRGCGLEWGVVRGSAWGAFVSSATSQLRRRGRRDRSVLLGFLCAPAISNTLSVPVGVRQKNNWCRFVSCTAQGQGEFEGGVRQVCCVEGREGGGGWLEAYLLHGMF